MGRVRINSNLSRKIVFLCKRNVVRSYFTEVIFGSLYPELNFISAGFIPPDPSESYSWRTDLFRNWGITDPLRNPVIFESIQNQIGENDIIVLLDSDSKFFLIGFEASNPKVQIIEVSKFLPHWANTFDPWGMKLHDVVLSISRSLFASHQVLWNYLPLEKTNNEVVFWDSTKTFYMQVEEFCKNEISRGKNVVFLQPFPFADLEECINIYEGNIADSAHQLCLGNPKIWMPNYEYESLERLILNRSWLEETRQFITLMPMSVVGGPLRYRDAYISTPLLLGLLNSNFKFVQ